jgi:hypothetical protein
MANISRINGFRPVKHLTGAPYNGQANVYYVPSGTNVFVGDPVKLVTGGSTIYGYDQVTKATALGAVVGVVVGIINPKFDPLGGAMSAGAAVLDTPQYVNSATGGYVLVCDSPDMLFEVEAATGANLAYAFALANVGKNADLTTVAGSTTTGTSAAALDMSGAAVTPTLQWRIMSPVQRPDNETTGNYTKVLVKINNHQLSAGTGAAGV